MKHGAKRRWFTSVWVTATVAFFVSLAVFSATFLIPRFIAQWDRPAPAEVVGEQGRTRSVWLLLHEGDRLTSAVWIGGDTATLTIDVVGYPANTEVVYSTALCPLWQCYRETDVACTTYLEAVSGRTADATISLSADAFAAFTARLGNGISYTLPEPVGMLPQGQQQLMPLQIADVLRFDEWEDTVTGQATANADIVKIVIDRYLNTQCDLDAAFRALTALCEQHLTIAQFTVLRPDLETLAGDGVVCTSSVPQGHLSGIDKYRRYVLE